MITPLIPSTVLPSLRPRWILQTADRGNLHPQPSFANGREGVGPVVSCDDDIGYVEKILSFYNFSLERIAGITSK